MRIIAGSHRSRTIDGPRGLATRPTSDRLRETLFNVLAPRIQGARFLDLYAGSGAVGIEALSRGAEQVVMIERAPAALKVLKGNLQRLGFTSGFQIYSGAVGPWLKQSFDARRFDLVFLDPPYDAADEYTLSLRLLGGSAADVLGEGAWVVAEHRKKDRLSERYGALTQFRRLEQGDAALSFFASRRQES